jgi:hypothetical protein
MLEILNEVYITEIYFFHEYYVLLTNTKYQNLIWVDYFSCVTIMHFGYREFSLCDCFAGIPYLVQVVQVVQVAIAVKEKHEDK